MVSSNNSVKEIASSVKLTAEAIEQQTMQTNGIQTNIENAEKETKEMQTASDATQDALREGADPVSYTHLKKNPPRSIDRGGFPLRMGFTSFPFRLRRLPALPVRPL